MTEELKQPEIVLENGPTGTLNQGEIHPMSQFAVNFVLDIKNVPTIWEMLKKDMQDRIQLDDRKALICFPTLEAIENDMMIVDRYLFGLVVYIMEYLEHLKKSFKISKTLTSNIPYVFKPRKRLP
ncbi:MAG: hypothetical protein KGI54_09540 [Pseudomonadota bacterium]|nr:hypothetical protein [Pseudomonadota bacterium]